MSFMLNFRKMPGVMLLGILLLLSGLSGCDSGGGSLKAKAPEGPYLRGTILIEAGTRVDQDTALDVAFLGRPAVSNPQQPALPADVLLGGFVSAASGVYDNVYRFPYPQDPLDAYEISLIEGQRVSIAFFPGEVSGAGEPMIRFSLIALESDRGVVDEEESTALNRTLVADAKGDYRIEIEALSGPPVRYVLTSAAMATGQALEWQSTDFISGEAIVTMDHQPGAMRAAAVAPVRAASQRGLGRGQYRMRMPVDRALRAQGNGRRDAHQETLDWIAELRQQPGVASVSPNYRMELAGEPTEQEQYASQQWHYDLINMTAAWSNGDDASGIRVAVLDTGVLSPGDDGVAWHPALDPNIDCNAGQCFNAVDPGTPPVDFSASVFHGTHVAGTVAASVSEHDQIAGVAYGAQLVPVKVLSEQGGSVADVIAGINWVINDGHPRADIINLSLGGTSHIPALQRAVEDAEAAGIVVVAAAGNNASSRRFYPAAYESVLAVGAVVCEGFRSGFSNFGVWLDLVAPGGGNAAECGDDKRGIFSASGSRSRGNVVVEYGGLNGTSMAAPHVSGVLALLLGRHLGPVNDLPAVVRALVREQLLLTNIGERFNEDWGWGLIDASALAGLPDLGQLTVLTPDRRRIEFGAQDTSQRLGFTASGHRPDDITDLALTARDGWLSISPASDGKHFDLILDRDGLDAERRYRTDIDVTYSAGEHSGSFSLPVTVAPDLQGTLRDAGYHFVLLIPTVPGQNGDETLEVEAEAIDGQYHFKFDLEGIDPGEYLLIAGSDIDNDGFLCGPGEACAEYPVTGQPQPITINKRTRKTVEMTTSFTRPVDSQILGRPGFEGYRRVQQ